ncbi:efflux RND transporter permease subunit [Erythrobacter alti]|uniref:efflux RND transporter permease subunit n=1 Tax=Erythrobacter alti TaxID=1896145 RepID=UPI0030F3C7F2
MDFNQISAWSIRNPIVPILLFVGLTLAGIVSFSRMDVQNNPDIEFPIAIVSISQPGAAPTEVENQITQRVEAAVQTLDGIENIRSTASEGNSFTVIEFELGTDIDAVVNEVNSAVDQIRGELPDGILEPRVFKQQTSSRPIVYFAVDADDMTIEQLSWFIDDTITKRLLQVEGLAEVNRNGGVDREILVILDPARMQSLGLTAAQVNAALRQLNINAAGGQSEIAGSRQSVRVLGNAQSVFELSQAQLSLNGRSIKLSDIARVSDSYGELRSMSKLNGEQIVTFSVTRARGESDVAVYDGVVEALQDIEAGNPGVSFTRLFTEVDYTKAQYESSLAAMVEGALLAVIVVFLFLRDWRATIIASLAIPLSAIPTFWFLEAWFGFTLNTMSLLALGLVAGVLVDDAIVEIENIVRHMRMGKSAYQASIDAADEIGLAVVATTFSIVAVFLPVGLMSGITGIFFKNFGITVVVSVLMSLAVARMITPMIAAYFLKAKGQASHGEGPMMDRYMSVLRWSLDDSALRRRVSELGRAPFKWQYGLIASPLFILIAGAGVAAFGYVIYFWFGNETLAQSMDARFWTGEFDVLPNPIAMFIGFILAVVSMSAAVFLAGIASWVAGGLLRIGLTFLTGILGGDFHKWFVNRLGRLRARFLDHRMWMMGIGVGALAMTIFTMVVLPKQFFPATDSDFSLVRIEMVPGTTLEQTEIVVDAVSARLKEEQEVALALGIANEGNGLIRLVLAEDRVRDSLQFEREMTTVLQDFPDARINFQDQSGPGGGSATGRAISKMLAGSDPEALNATAETLAEQMRGIPGIVAPRVELDLQRPELLIEPREELAASLGVTTAALSQAIRIATLGDIDQNAAKFSLSDRQVPIRVRLAESERRDLSTIRNLPVPTSTGGSVPLERVADIRFGMGPTSIERYNQSRRVFIGADIAPGFARGDIMPAIDQLPIMRDLPTGVTSPAVGQDEAQEELQQSFVPALLTGILLVFAVLVLLYRRLVSPLVNMGSLFLAPLGGLLLVMAVGMELTLPVFIGMLMLFGIVSKNSILLIDFALEELETGKPKREAIIEAGHKRAQPIVMTTVAMTAGMIPTALALSADGAWRQPMGLVVIGGLILSTLLTLLIVPAGFSLADGLEKRFGPWMRERFLTYKPGDDIASGAEPQPAE